MELKCLNVYFSGACHNIGGQYVYYDPSCLNPGADARGGVGCNAGGQGQGCRFGWTTGNGQPMSTELWIWTQIFFY